MKKFILLALVTLALTLGWGWRGIAQTNLPLDIPSNPRRIVTQSMQVQVAVRLIYEQMPEIPLENQYLNTRTGQVNPEDNLISRLLRYHLVTKNRPPSLRFDWKMTIADYLEANEPMVEDRYPGTDILQPNPMRPDRAAIARLTPAQRNQLVNLLVAAYTPVAIVPARIIFPTPATPVPTPQPSPPLDRIPLPQPGDAQFLRL
ncbi:MAG: hypothetical protein HC916_05710 [Coleofasciculaceae cyanobacterium SM2_1_6]|nr:hypothetical protein [Coleofasciculaceae cyanobacterium SM2_1_6]